MGTVTPLPTFTFSSDLNTVVSQLTATSGVVNMTSTSAALTASPTPTNIGASTSTPNNLQQTATSIVLTTVPTSAYGQPTVTLLADTSAMSQEIPITSGEPDKAQKPGTMFWILGIGLLFLLLLLYVLNKELRKSSAKSK
jgi:hypothetical protein